MGAISGADYKDKHYRIDVNILAITYNLKSKEPSNRL